MDTEDCTALDRASKHSIQQIVSKQFIESLRRHNSESMLTDEAIAQSGTLRNEQLEKLANPLLASDQPGAEVVSNDTGTVSAMHEESKDAASATPTNKAIHDLQHPKSDENTCIGYAGRISRAMVIALVYVGILELKPTSS